jgi:hypothetical protein
VTKIVQDQRVTVFPSTPLEKHLAKAMEPVGTLAWKVVENLLLAKAKLAAGGGALVKQVKLTPLDDIVVTEAAVRLELAAVRAFTRLMDDKEFWALLRAENARRLSKDRAQRQSRSFALALQETPGATWKEIARKLEQRGDLIDEGEHYRMGNTRIKKLSLPAKLSRLRRKATAP